MKKYGYIKKTLESRAMAKAKQQLEAVGCDVIITDEVEKNVTRPNLNELIKKLRSGDTLYLYKFANAVSGALQLMYLLEVCRDRGVRVVSTDDDLDTDTIEGRLWQTMLGSFPREVKSWERAETAIRRAGHGFGLEPTRPKYEDLETRDARIIELYRAKTSLMKIGEQFAISRTQVYRVLKKHGINKDRHGQYEEPNDTNIVDSTEN